MPSRGLMMFCVFVGSMAGSYLPALFGVSLFSFTSVIMGGIGGILGIYMAFKIAGQ